MCVYIHDHSFLLTDMVKLHRAKEQNDRLSAENQTLRERVHTLESEKKTLLDQVGLLYVFIKVNPQKVAKAVADVWYCLVLCFF